MRKNLAANTTIKPKESDQMKFLKSLAIISLAASFALAAQSVATVNGKEITTNDIASFLKAMPNVDYAQLTPELKERVIQQVIEKQLLLAESKKEGIENAPEFKEALETAKDEIALEVWMKKQFDKITVTDEDAKKFYEANTDRFKQPASYKARHILVKKEDEAKSILKELSKAKDKSEAAFSEAAKKHSIDGSAQNGGDLGWFAEGQMVKPFFDAAKALKKGEYTKSPVKTQFGFHLIYMDDTKAAGKVPFETAKEQIKNMLKMDKFKESVSQRAKDLREKAKVEIKK